MFTNIGRWVKAANESFSFTFVHKWLNVVNEERFGQKKTKENDSHSELFKSVMSLRQKKTTN